MFKSITVFKIILLYLCIFILYIYFFFILFLFVKCYLHALRYCILGILHILYFTHLFLGMFVKRLRAILIDRALYKYCIITTFIY